MIRISPRFSFPSFHHDFGTLVRSQVDFKLIDRCGFLDSGCSTFFLVDAIREGTHARSDGRSNGGFQFVLSFLFLRSLVQSHPFVPGSAPALILFVSSFSVIFVGGDSEPRSETFSCFPYLIFSRLICLRDSDD